MKVGLVLDDTLDTSDGVQQYVLRVGEWLTAKGHEVHYLVGETTRTDIANVHSLSRNLQVRFNGNRMSMPLPTPKATLRVFLAEQKFDVLHIQVPYSPFMAGRLLTVAPANTAVVGTFHILPYSSLVTFANRLLAVMNYRSGKRFNHMLAVTGPAATFARRAYGYRAEVVPNPVRLSQFSGVTNKSATTNIVFLGRLVKRKGPLELLQAVAYMRENGLHKGDIRVLVGSKGELLAQLEAFVQAHRLFDTVSLEGFIEEAKKAEFLAQADIAVYPSTGGESFGIVLLEGMAAARGVVLAGNNPGYASVMQPYPDQLFDPTDIQAFAKKLAWYLDHPMARERAAELQHQYVRRFDIEVVGPKLLQVYAEALQSQHES
ncbi:MAG TPA: glycosyltransferase family 4 protein [Candidatus Saccharimonadales bacterium]|nr:glycosyltransferase family 4 protein [Candidatus Saccharimonadales bacterium]